MKSSLGVWLAICLAGLQFIAVTGVVYSSYVTSERVLLNHAQSLLSDVATNASATASGFLEPARGAAELSARLAESQVVSSENRDRLERFLFQQLQTSPQFSGVFYGTEKGEFVFVKRNEDVDAPFQSKIVTYPQGVRQTELTSRSDTYQILEQRLDLEDSYDPRKRPWYIDAKDTGASIWTDPYVFFTAQEAGITTASPVMGDDGQLKGVIGVDIEISAISNFLGDLNIGERGVALIINHNGDVIAHPNILDMKTTDANGKLRFAGIDEVDDMIAREAFGYLFKDGQMDVAAETYRQFSYDGGQYISTIMPNISDELPWNIAVYAPKHDFVGAIVANRRNDIWIAAGIAIATGLLGLFLANQIHRPVRAFAVRAALISQGELDPDAPTPKTFKELDRINTTLTTEIVNRREAENEYGLTFDLSSHGMVQLDPKDGQILRANARYSEISGYGIEELLTMKISDIGMPDDPMPFAKLVARTSDDKVFNIEKRFMRKNGDLIWIKVNAVMTRDKHGKPRHFVATVDDITQNIDATSQIRKLSRDLSHLARGEMLGQMAAGLAHELNQPLTAITQNIDAAMFTLKDMQTDSDELQQILGDVDEQAQRAGEIIRSLRGFARKGDDLKEPFDMEELLYQSAKLVQTDINESGINITVANDDLPMALGIRVQVAQVMVNLLRNAIEVILDCGDVKKLISVTALRKDDFIEVCVEDSGSGVSPDIDLFSQFETSKDTGMGLGLSICRSIIEAGGGRMWHDGSGDGGARFLFTVPILTGQAALGQTVEMNKRNDAA